MLSPRRRIVITAGVMTGTFLAALEATIVGTAMPTVVAALGGLAHFSWVFSVYLLTSTVSVPLWGKLSDLYGRRFLYQLAIAVFLVGSALSGLSQSMPQLIAARALQGLGAGGLIPLGMTIIGDIYSIQERARMQGWFSGVWGLSSIIGPLVGGFVTDQISWRWVFFINIPIGVVAAVIMGIALVEQKRATRPSIDYLGAVVLTTGVTLLMMALVDGGSIAELLRLRNLILFVVVMALLAWFLRIERRAAEPVIPLELFRNRLVALAMIIGFLAGVAMFGAISFVPLFAQGSRGVSATAAGSFLTPLMLAWVSASVVGGRLLIRVGWRPLVVTGLLLLVAGFAGLTAATTETASFVLVIELTLIGCGLGLTMLTLLIAVQHAVPRHQLGIATSLNQFFRSIGGAMGVALLGALLTAGMSDSIHEDPSALIDRESQMAMEPAELEAMQESLARSIRTVFLASGVVCAIALLFAFFLPAGAPVSERDDGEKFVMAEMTVIDPEHEPQG
ncbi:MAG TPA: MDR family MFS transporter [Thermoanaerobaculia bacterium]|nr:MDR family MFS transporter [Thermoanaerobaculia bacterium]